MKIPLCQLPLLSPGTSGPLKPRVPWTPPWSGWPRRLGSSRVCRPWSVSWSPHTPPNPWSEWGGLSERARLGSRAQGTRPCICSLVNKEMGFYGIMSISFREKAAFIWLMVLFASEEKKGTSQITLSFWASTLELLSRAFEFFILCEKILCWLTDVRNYKEPPYSARVNASRKSGKWLGEANGRCCTRLPSK